MHLIQNLLKNTLEKQFQLSNLTIDIKSEHTLIYPIFESVYNQNHSNIILYPPTTQKFAFLLKHPNIINIHSFKQINFEQITYQGILTPQIQTVNIIGPSILLIFKNTLNALIFIYQNNLKLKNFTLDFIKLQSGKSVFFALDQIDKTGLSEKEIIKILKQEFKIAKTWNVQFFDSLVEIANQSVVQGELFQLVEDMQSQDFLNNSAIFDQIIVVSQKIDANTVSQFLITPIFNVIKDQKIVQNSHFGLFIQLVFKSLQYLSKQQADFLVQKVIQNPSLADCFKALDLTNLTLSEESIPSLQKLLIWGMQKSNLSTEILNFQLILAQIFNENAQNIIDFKTQNSFFKTISDLISRTSKYSNIYISWALWNGIQKLLALYENLKEKGAKIEENVFCGLSPQLFIDNFFTSILLSLQQYDCTMAAYCLCNDAILQLLEKDQLFAVLGSLNSKYCLNELVYSLDGKKRQLGQSLVQKVDVCCKGVCVVKQQQVVQPQKQQQKQQQNQQEQNEQKQYQQQHQKQQQDQQLYQQQEQQQYYQQEQFQDENQDYQQLLNYQLSLLDQQEHQKEVNNQYDPWNYAETENQQPKIQSRKTAWDDSESDVQVESKPVKKVSAWDDSSD